MSVLHNRISNNILKSRMWIDTEERITVSFYKYCRINTPKEFRDALYIFFSKLNILGRVYVSKEGINAQISVPVHYYNIMQLYLEKLHLEFKGLRINKALDNQKSFWVLKIKVRKNIVSDGIDKNVIFDPNNVGVYLKSVEVNEMLNDNNVIFVDMRNHYEYEIGHFERAIPIPANTFRDQLKIIVHFLKDYKDRKIVMYCTGGIRCEKATFWMKYNGFKKIHHIEGGIIGYYHDAKKNNLPILFKGKNFVFDTRLGERISNDIISNCYQCKVKCDIHVNCKHNLCHSLFIQCSICSDKFQGCCSTQCLQLIKKYKC